MMGPSPPVLLCFRQQRRQGAMVVITRDLVVPIAKDPLDGIGFRAVARQPQQDQTRVVRQPAADVPGGVNAVVVRHPVPAPKARPGVGAMQGPKQIQKQAAVFLGSRTVPDAACAEVERGGQLAALILAGRDDLEALAAWGPRRPYLGP